MRTGLLTAIAILTIAGSGAAFAGNGYNSVPNGYALPDFWGPGSSAAGARLHDAGT